MHAPCMLYNDCFNDNYVRSGFFFIHAKYSLGNIYSASHSLLPAVKFIGSRMISYEVTPFTIIDINTRSPDAKRAGGYRFIIHSLCLFYFSSPIRPS